MLNVEDHILCICTSVCVALTFVKAQILFECIMFMFLQSQHPPSQFSSRFRSSVCVFFLLETPLNALCLGQHCLEVKFTCLIICNNC